MNQGSINGSFLVLNVGTNTLGLGSSVKTPVPSESFQQTPTGKTSTPTGTAIDSADDTDSTEEGSFSASETSKSKRVSEGEEDPDWVPQRKARRCNSSASRTIKSRQGPSVSSNPPKISSGGLSGMLNSSSGPPPTYLMGLLGLYGWKIVREPGKGDYIFVSPQGIPYYSFPKAFETFLQGTSKYSDRATLSSRYLENSSFGDSSVERAVPSSNIVGSEGGNVADVTGKKSTGRKKKQSNVEEKIESVKEQPQRKDEPLLSNRKMPAQMEETTECQEGNRSGELFGVRRSGRISGKHVPKENETNIMSGPSFFGDRAKHKEQNPTSSQMESMLNERPEACKVDKVLNKEVGSSGCNTIGVMKSSTICKAKRSMRSRRPGHINKKYDFLNREFDAEKRAETNFSVGKEVVKSLVLESLEDEKMDWSKNGESFHSETKRKDCNSGVLPNNINSNAMHGCSDTTRIRRSIRINGKHVPVDDDSDPDISYDEYFLYPSDFEENTVVKNGNEKPMTSCFKDDMLKHTNVDDFGCQKSSFNDSTASLKETSEKFAVPEKFFSTVVADREVASGDNSYEKKKKKRRGGCGLTIRRNKKDDDQEEIISQKEINLLSWLIDCGTLAENDKVYYITKSSTGNIPSGVITRRGIWCNCCKEQVALPKFVAHAGGNLYLPWDSIFLLSGKTLLLCLKEAWEKEKKQRKVGFQTVGIGDPDPSDDTCGVCADGGHLICCDTCPSTFHQNCLMLKTLPEGSWYCPYCRCTFCTTMMSGSDMPLEALNLLSCKQCGRKYHKGCAWGNNVELTGSVPISFCGENCSKVSSGLLDMLGIRNQIEGEFSWTLLKRFDEDAGIFSNQMVSFIMESNVKLSMALSVLDECFVPLIDQRTGVDMLCQAVYNCGSNFNRLNYEGFYTLILERGEELIAAASLRLHGTSLAEMPFVGTRPMYRRQGMCRRLLGAVEKMLHLLHVEKLVIPAIPDLLETWTKSFSFKPLEPSHKEEIRNLSLMVFAETTLLQKPIFTKVHVNDSVRCRKKTLEMHEQQRTSGDQINNRSHFGDGKTTHEGHELPRSVGDHGNTTAHSGGSKSVQEEPQLPKRVDGKINTRNCFVGEKGTQEANDELPISNNDKQSTRSHFGEGKSIQRGHTLPISVNGQMSTQNYFISRKSMQENPVLPRMSGDKINTRSHFGVRKSTQEGQDVAQSNDDQLNSRNQYGRGKNIQEGQDAPRSIDEQRNISNPFECGKNTRDGINLAKAFGDQISTRSHFGLGGGQSMQDGLELPRGPQYQTNSGGPFGGSRNMQETHELPRSFGDQVNTIRGSKSIQEGYGLPKTFSNQTNTNNFGVASDWWIYGCILKGQADAALEPARLAQDFSIAANSSSPLLSPNIPSPCFQRTFETNLSSISHPLSAMQSIDAALDGDPLGLETDTSVDNRMNIWSQGSNEVRDLQMDAIRSSLSFDNLLSS